MLVSVLIPKANQTMKWVFGQKTDSSRDSFGLIGSDFEYGLLVRIHILLSYLLYQILDEKEELG